MLKLVLAFIAFISIGMPDTLLGIAWPTLRVDLGVGFDAVGWIVLAGTAGYCLSALAAGPLLRRLGLGWLLTWSTLITAVGLLCFGYLGHYLGLVILTLVLGTGGGAVDTGLNHYVIDHHGEGMMQWLHASFGLGVTLSPLVMGVALTQGGYALGYLWTFAALACIAVLFGVTRNQWPRLAVEEETHAKAQHTPRLWLAVAMFVVYVACEVVVGVMAYSVFVESRGIDALIAAGYVSLYWGAFTGARVLMGFVADRLSHWTLVRFGIGTGALGALVFSIMPGFESFAMVLMGLGFGPLYPGLMSGTADRAGEENKDAAVGLQVGISVLGAGVLTLLIGQLGGNGGRELIPWAVVAMVFLLALGARQQRSYQLSTR